MQSNEIHIFNSIYFFLIRASVKLFKNFETVVTAIQGLIDAADEQLNKRENSTDLSKVSLTHTLVPYESSVPLFPNHGESHSK